MGFLLRLKLLHHLEKHPMQLLQLQRFSSLIAQKISKADRPDQVIR
jgi:hypothetical protein